MGPAFAGPSEETTIVGLTLDDYGVVGKEPKSDDSVAEGNEGVPKKTLRVKKNENAQDNE